MSKRISRPWLQLLFDMRAGRAVEVGVDLGALEQFAGVAHALKLGDVDEMIMLAVDLIGAAGARRHRDRERDVGVLLEDGARDG